MHANSNRFGKLASFFVFRSRNECESLSEREIKDNNNNNNSPPSSALSSNSSSYSLTSSSVSSTSILITTNHSILSKYGLNTHMGTASRPNIGILWKNHHQNPSNSQQQRSKLSQQKYVFNNSYSKSTIFMIKSLSLLNFNFHSKIEEDVVVIYR